MLNVDGGVWLVGSPSGAVRYLEVCKPVFSSQGGKESQNRRVMIIIKKNVDNVSVGSFFGCYDNFVGEATNFVCKN